MARCDPFAGPAGVAHHADRACAAGGARRGSPAPAPAASPGPGCAGCRSSVTRSPSAAAATRRSITAHGVCRSDRLRSDVVVAERRAEQRGGGQRGGHPGHADHVDLARRRTPARGWPSRRRPASPEPISATACPARASATALRARSSSAPSPLASTRVPGRSRSRTWSRYWSRPTTTAARGAARRPRAGCAGRARRGPRPTTPAGRAARAGRPRPWPSPTAASAPAASRRRRRSAAASATLGVPTAARTTSLGLRHVDRRQVRRRLGHAGVRRARRRRPQDARLVGFHVDAGQAAQAGRAQPGVGERPSQQRVDLGGGHAPAGRRPRRPGTAVAARRCGRRPAPPGR